MAELHKNDHPAPVPVFVPTNSPDQSFGIPPKPRLEGSRGNYQGTNVVDLTWHLPEVPQTNIESFEVYYYRETDAPSSLFLWKKLLHTTLIFSPRIIFASLTQNSRYHFIVRAKGVNNSLGPFSDPVSVDLKEM